MAQLAAMHLPMLYFHYSIDAQGDVSRFTQHCHNMYEVYLFIRGHGLYRIEGRLYPLAPYHLLLIRPGEFHSVQLDDMRPYERYALHFQAELLEDVFRQELLAAFDSRPLGVQNLLVRADRLGLLPYFERLAACCTLPEPDRSLLARYLASALLAQLRCARKPIQAASHSEPDLGMRALEYLNTHLTEPLSLDALAQALYASKHYIGRQFRALTGASVMEYVIQKRVALARQWIIQGQAPHVAAAQAGFGDYSVFYRAYRRIVGNAPSDDRPGSPRAAPGGPP